jgi:glutathione S-transferase
MIKLYGFPRSRSTRVVWMLEELGVDYDFEKIELLEGGGQTEAYLKIHADGKVPAIDDDGFVLTESAAIVTYLGDKYPEAKLVPETQTKARAKYDEWCFFILTELEQPLWTVGKHTFVFPEDKRVPEILDIAFWEFKKACKALERNMAGREFAMGEEFSAVDILLAHTFRWADAFGVPTGSEALDSYRDRISARPSFEKVAAREALAG